MAEQFSNRWEEHAKTVSEPAERAKKEGVRRIIFGPASAEYDLAPLPDGRTAIQVTCALASNCSMKIPWRAFPKREEAIGFFLRETTAFFERAGALQKEQEAARKQIMAILEPNTLFGFSEPEPGEPPPASTSDPVEAAEETEEDEPDEEADEPAPFTTEMTEESYARIAREKNKRGLLCMLRDARKSLAHHGRRSWMGKQAKLEIAAAEKELARRNMPIPAEGQETAKWDRKQSDD